MKKCYVTRELYLSYIQNTIVQHLVYCKPNMFYAHANVYVTCDMYLSNTDYNRATSPNMYP
jgi:hypothetical protein